MLDAERIAQGAPADSWEGLKEAIREAAGSLRMDGALLSELGLRLDVANIIDFGPVALSRASAAHLRESSERQRLEATARANFAAQAQTHAAVIDLLEADSLCDLARRVDELARLRFGLAGGVLAVEGPEEAPAGWRPLARGQADLILEPSRMARMGRLPTALGLFGAAAPQIGSVALVRLGLWEGSRKGVIAFGASDEEAFTAEMGSDLIAFLAKVVERTAARWPAP